MKKMEEIAYWIKTKRAPCLYKYDMINKKHSDAHCSKSKDTLANRDIISSSKNKKKRKLSIFDESESEHNEKNVYFDDTPAVPVDTPLSSCKDSIISNTELQAKEPPSKAARVRKPTLKANAVYKRNLRSVSKTQNNDSSLESGLFSGETKNKQSSLSKSLSKKSAEKYATGDDAPIKKSVNKVGNGLYDDMSDVSGFTANYIRSTKNKSSHHLTKPKKSSKHLINESQDKIYVNKHVETTRDPLHCSSDSSNIINVVTVNNKKQNGKLDKQTSLLKFVTPTQHTPKLRPRRKTSTPAQSSVASRYFTRSKATSFEDLSLLNSENTSTPIKRDTQRVSARHIIVGKQSSNESSSIPVKNDIERVTAGHLNVGSCKRSSHTTSIKCDIQRVSAGHLNVGSCKRSSHSTTIKSDIQRVTAGHVGSGKRSSHSSHKRVSDIINASNVNARDKSGFSACFSDSDSEQREPKSNFFD